MDRLEKLISNNIDIVFIVALIEAIIIIALLIYFIYNRQHCNDVIHGDDYSDNNSIYTNYNRAVNNINDLKKAIRNAGLEIIYTNTGIQLSQIQKVTTISQGTRRETTIQTGTTHEDPVIEELKKLRSKDKADYQKADNGENNLDSKDDKPMFISTPLRYEYLEAANSGQFRKLLPSDEKCFFRTWEENGIRRYEFHGNVDKALANINAIFDETCEIEGKQNGATNIINVEPGILDSKLKVETKAKIKMI